MDIKASPRVVLATLALTFAHPVTAADYDPDMLTVSAASVVPKDVLQGKHYRIVDEVRVKGFMNHYTVESDFGKFAAVGTRNLNKLLHEIDAIATLKEMGSVEVGADAALDTLTEKGKSIAALADDPEGSVDRLGEGVSRLFKRTKKKVKDVGARVVETATKSGNGAGGNGGSDAAEVAEKMATSYLGIDSARRRIASELKVDPYSDNAVLQAELERVAKIAGSVGKITGMAIPIPAVLGQAASISDLVWKLSPTDLLIQNQETLKGLGYRDDLIEQFLSSTMYSPTEQTALVAAIKSLSNAKGSKTVLRNAAKVETPIEGEFMVRALLFARLYHEKVDPVTEILFTRSGLVPITITRSGDGVVFVPVDRLLWTKEVAGAAASLSDTLDEHGGSDEHLLWVDGEVSKLALAGLEAAGWVQTPDTFDKLEQMIRN